MCNTIAREVALSSSGTELIRSGLESPARKQSSRSPSTRHSDQKKIRHLSRSGQQLIKDINSSLNAMPSANPILAAAKNMVTPDTYCKPCAFPVSGCFPRFICNATALTTHCLLASDRRSRYPAVSKTAEPTPRRKTTANLVRACDAYPPRLSAIAPAAVPLINFTPAQEAINRPVTSDLENTKREPHPVLSESRPHTTHDITSTSNFLAGVDKNLLQQASSLARQLDSRGNIRTASSRCESSELSVNARVTRVFMSACRAADGRRVAPNGGRLTPMGQRK